MAALRAGRTRLKLQPPALAGVDLASSPVNLIRRHVSAGDLRLREKFQADTAGPASAALSPKVAGPNGLVAGFPGAGTDMQQRCRGSGGPAARPGCSSAVAAPDPPDFDFLLGGA